MAEPVVLKVRMSCGGCAGAVKRALGKLEGVESFDVDLEQQKVTVKGTATPEAVLETVSKTGKKTEFWKDEPITPSAKEEDAPPAVALPESAAKDAAAAAAPEAAALDAAGAASAPEAEAETAAAAAPPPEIAAAN